MRLPVEAVWQKWEHDKGPDPMTFLCWEVGELRRLRSGRWVGGRPREWKVLEARWWRVFRRRECSSMSSAAGGVNKVRTEDWPLDLTTWRSLVTLIGTFHFALVPLVVEAKRKPNGFHNYHDFSLRNLPIFLRHPNFFWEFIMWIFTKGALDNTMNLATMVGDFSLLIIWPRYKWPPCESILVQLWRVPHGETLHVNLSQGHRGRSD